MANPIIPTKGNLIAAKRSLALCKLGFDLMDRKRNVLTRELMQLVDQAKALRGSIETIYTDAYAMLQDANITLGVVDHFANAVPIDYSVSLSTRSVMGVEIPKITHTPNDPLIPYGFLNTSIELDSAYAAFCRVRNMTLMLAEVDNGVFRLATAIQKTQRRANALKNILIPRYLETIRVISDSLEEKEREEFTRMKMIKAKKISFA
ncbi:MAG: V-type ATP synthase subunit D [Oscillospiraceae bacterium]|nr:V-type ATP synthase subunit D [Oscillospiraceae bacterium]